ncbi:hypothetical protein [Roseibium aggregatum]|uniref:Uncharacterized protein n=1 Tax=Roseibium aggregatum TaxID=187304 RepID=A0A939EIJ2_9HYPH|nr:hypothetical protein [Roseibium aggregatum]MBN9672355.1 hypothetical protein [Roseibium aggregatum]
MKRYWIAYQDMPVWSPMAFWVHLPTRRNQIWVYADAYDPPLTRPVGGRGFPAFLVEIDGFTFYFASLAELRELIRVFEMKLMPSVRHLCRERGSSKGPNSHWLSRLPARVKPWRYRQKALPFLRQALDGFERQLASDRK